MALTLTDIARVFHERGAQQYTGEPVTQLAHALQTAQQAQDEGADDELVTAALLHDLGHLLHDLGATPTLQGKDDLHQFRALPALRGIFGSGVTDPIKLHVDAKRYLCATRPEYFAALSQDSRRSLALQGGIHNADEAAAFMRLAGAPQAVRLRVWDDRAKRERAATLPLSHFLERARRCAMPA